MLLIPAIKHMDSIIPIHQGPEYSLQSLANINTTIKIEADKKNMLNILNRWKHKQGEDKPLMIVFNFSGGGVRSAAFAMSILQERI